MKILVLAGGADQIALIQELKSRGHVIILVDYFDNPPAKSFADKHIVASTLDVDTVYDIAVNEHVDLVCTACTDQALLTVAFISEKLGLPCYLSYQTGLNVTNKAYMKKVLCENKIPTSKYAVTGKVDLRAVEGFRFPLVVKPVDCNSSKGVKKVATEEDLIIALEEAICYSRTKTAIIEEYKSGIEISADYYIEKGKAKYLSATASTKLRSKDCFTILSSDYPAINEEQEKRITQIAQQISQAFSLEDCPLLMQLIVNGEDINVIEFSARMGGGAKYKLIEVLSGENIMKKYVDLILGEKPLFDPRKQVNYCKMVYLYCYPGIFDHVEGFEELKSQGYMDEYFLFKTKGMIIEKANTSGDRPAGYLVTANNKEEMKSKIRHIDKSLKVVSSNNNDIMMHGLCEM